MADGVNDAEAGSPSDLPALVGGGPGGRDYQARADRDAELGRDDGQLARPFDVATILNELTMDEPWTAAAADDDDDGGPLRLDPAAAAAAAAAAGDSDGDLGVPPNPPPPSSGPPAASAADRRGSAGVAEPAGSAARPASPNSPSFVEVSLNAWSDGGGGGVRSPPSHRHHASSAHAFSNPFSASAALPAVRRSSSGVGHSNPWAATSPVNKDTIVGASADDLGPFVNVSPDDHDFRYAGRRGSLSHALAGHGAGNLRRSMSASSAAAATIPEDVELAEKRSVSSSSVFGWLSKLSTTKPVPSKTRQPTLPPKDPKEERKHLNEYLKLQKSAAELEKKREAKQRQQREARESHMHNTLNVWEKEIIPSWLAKSSFPFQSSPSAGTPKAKPASPYYAISLRTRKLWYQGIPPKCRGTVWCLRVGNDAGVTKEMYDLCAANARNVAERNGYPGKFDELLADATPTEPASRRFSPSRGSGDGGGGGFGGGGGTRTSADGGAGSAGAAGVPGPDPAYAGMCHEMEMDILRTFPSLKLFQPGGPFYPKLVELLETYMCWGNDIGYVQGMSHVAAMLLLNMDPMPAFVCFANILRRPLHAAFFRMDVELTDAYFKVFKEIFVIKLPTLYTHFQKIGVQPDLYVYDWFLTVFSQTLSLELSTRMWDLFLCDGNSFLFRASVAVLAAIESRLYGDFDEVLYTLTHVSSVDPPVTEAGLMRCIEDTKVEEKEFAELCARYRCDPG